MKFDPARADAEQARGFLAGGVGHDLRQQSPLALGELLMAEERAEVDGWPFWQVLAALLGRAELGCLNELPSAVAAGEREMMCARHVQDVDEAASVQGIGA